MCSLFPFHLRRLSYWSRLLVQMHQLTGSRVCSNSAVLSSTPPMSAVNDVIGTWIDVVMSWKFVFSATLFYNAIFSHCFVSYIIPFNFAYPGHCTVNTCLVWIRVYGRVVSSRFASEYRDSPWRCKGRAAWSTAETQRLSIGALWT